MKTETKKIFLVRHGRSAWNGKKRVSGQLDPPLSEEGFEQAQSLRQVLRTEKIDAVHTSTLSRAVKTAEPTARDHRLDINRHENLKEINFGEMQGRYRDGRDPEAEALWAQRETNKEDFRFPGGETFEELEQRVKQCLDEILKSSGNVLIVGHRSTNRAILAHLLGLTRSKAMSLRPRSKYLYEIELGDAPAVSTIRITDGKRQEGFIE